MGITALLALTLFIIILLYNYYEEGEEVGTCIFFAFVGFFIVTAIGLIITGMIGSSSIVESHYVRNSNIVDGPTPIYALKDNFDTKGKFFLISGYIKEDLYYYYLTEDEDGFISLQNIKANNVKLRTTDENPSITVYKNDITFDSWWCYIYANTMLLNKRYTVFNVPPGSIINEFEINLE